MGLSWWLSQNGSFSLVGHLPLEPSCVTKLANEQEGDKEEPLVLLCLLKGLSWLFIFGDDAERHEISSHRFLKLCKWKTFLAESALTSVLEASRGNEAAAVILAGCKEVVDKLDLVKSEILFFLLRFLAVNFFDFVFVVVDIVVVSSIVWSELDALL